MSGLTVHIVARGADRAAGWYAEALGAEERGRIAVPDGRFMQIELWFGDAQVMLSDEFTELGVVSPETLEGSPVVLHLRVADVDAAWKRAVEAGAIVRQPLADQVWGERYGQFSDPFGHRWGLAQHLRDVPREDVARAVAAMFGGSAAS
ncbi:MAG TPA: VOC family protein [Gaiellaceae bacterium]|nr:VOC family protein [Gaiellaceae bacterium]